MRLKVPVKTPLLIRKLLPGLHFAMPAKDKVIYLTFDDGPLPNSCQWILNCLKEYEAKATFFLVGENAAKHPYLVKQILSEGHSIGNHTHNHLNGFKTQSSGYLKNTSLCHEVLLPDLEKNEKPMFRPPYGKIRTGQIRALKKAGFEIIMWDVLSKDYDAELSSDDIYRNVINNVRPGSIIVFHDNVKSEKNLRLSLPAVLKTLRQEGFSFDALRFPIAGI